MILFAKALLIIPPKEYVNYITQVIATPANRIVIDSVAEDFSNVDVSNIATSVGYLRFHFDTTKYQLLCNDDKLYKLSASADRYTLYMYPPNYTVGETYSFNCYVADINDEKKLLQKITINYTRTV